MKDKTIGERLEHIEIKINDLLKAKAVQVGDITVSGENAEVCSEIIKDLLKDKKLFEYLRGFKADKIKLAQTSYMG